VEFNMPNREDIALMAHLARRTGFGATRSELETLVEQGYDDVVEQLLSPEDQPPVDEYTLFRYHPGAERGSNLNHAQLRWLYGMVTTRRPLQEKMALFWHHVFATGQAKVESGRQMYAQIELFREQGMGNYRELLVSLSKDPAMLYWLDNNENHKRTPNENWGRELLELFSLGAGNYTEKDVFECARAFTGWTMSPKIHWLLWGPHLWDFEYRPEDHDNGEKTFLGHTGNFNGEDIIDIILQQPACARFIMRHLYNFFVADEPQVPAWPIEEPRDLEAITALEEVFVSSGYEMIPTLRFLLKSDFFKEAMYQKVKSPAEVVAGTLKLTGDLNGPDPRWGWVPNEPTYMGQALLDPPSVEGWHTGKEWINSGSLINRVNFVSEKVSNLELPGVQDIIRRVGSTNGHGMSADILVEGCLDQMGPLEVKEQTRAELVAQVESRGPVAASDEDFSIRVGEVLSLIAGTREYQFG
jgi:uncharacterized protein (DUF1800 family)